MTNPICPCRGPPVGQDGVEPSSETDITSIADIFRST